MDLHGQLTRASTTNLLRYALPVLLLSLQSTPSAASPPDPAHFSIKGLHIGMTDADLRHYLPSISCQTQDPVSTGYDATCATPSKVPESFATYASYPIETWGAYLSNHKVVALLVIFSGAEQPALRASLEKRYGVPEISGNPMSSLRWEFDGQRLSLGRTQSAATLLAVWDIKALNQVVAARRARINDDM